MAASRLLGYGLMVITAIGWAGAWMTAKVAAHDAPPVTVTVGRFLVASLALLPVWIALERGKALPARRDWPLLVAMGLTGAAMYTILFLVGVRYAPSSDGAVLTPGLSGVFAMLFTAVLARKVPAPRALAGAGLALAGCLLVGWNAFAHRADDAGRLVGDLLFVSSAFVWGVYTVLGKSASQRVSAVTSILAVSLVGSLALLPVALVLDGVPDLASWSTAAWVNVLYLGLAATAVAFVTFYAAVKIIGIDRTAPTLGLVPVFGVLGAAVLLDEPLTLLHAAGGALVVLGIVLPNVRMPARRAGPAAEGPVR